MPFDGPAPMSTNSPKPLAIRERLSEVRYEIRGELARRARELEAQGRKLIKLNIGNPGAFGFRAPEHLQRAIADDMGRTDPYTHQQGLPVAREAIAGYYARRGAPDAHPDRVFMGNGVSELIDLSLRALLNPGDEVLVPSPDYPLWSASTILNDGRPVYYRCAAENGFQPDPSEIETLVSSRTRAIVLINPNNPSGASYPRELLERVVEIARRHNLLLLVDEIYDQILYDDAVFQPVAPLAGDHPCLTFSGLSKVHRACGWRVGWAHLSGDDARLGDFRAALDLLGALRLCANVPGQYAIEAAVNGPDTISELCTPGGRLYETRRAVIEAWAFRRPVVAYAAGAPALLVEHEVDGLLVPEGDTAALADALWRLQTEPGLARRLGEAGRAKVEARFEARAVSERLYAQLGVGGDSH